MKSEIIYSAQKRGFLPGHRYANPRYFQSPRADVESVIVVGGWPDVVNAYRYAMPAIPVVEVPSHDALVDYLERRKAAGRRVAAPVAEAIPAITPEAIPADWHELPWPILKELAEKTKGGPVSGRPEALAVMEKAAVSHPFDHDGDGNPGGSLPATERGVCEDLRAEYERVSGKPADMRWGDDRLKREIAKALA